MHLSRTMSDETLTNKKSKELGDEDRFFVHSLVTFKIGESLFRVPQTGFSSSFLSSHSTPSTPESEQPPEGDFVDVNKLPSKPEKDVLQHTIELKGVAPDEFKSFLKILLPAPLGMEESLTQKDYESALKLATQFGGFEPVRSLCIARLEEMDLGSVRMIYIAQTYNVPQWLAPEIFKLAVREESLSVEDCSQLGLETVVRVGRLRDQRFNILSALADPGAHNAALAEFGIFAMDDVISMRRKHAEENPAEKSALTRLVKERQELADSLTELNRERNAIKHAEEVSAANALSNERASVLADSKKMLRCAEYSMTSTRSTLMNTFKSCSDDYESAERCFRLLFAIEKKKELAQEAVDRATRALESLDIMDPEDPPLDPSEETQQPGASGVESKPDPVQEVVGDEDVPPPDEGVSSPPVSEESSNSANNAS